MRQSTEGTRVCAERTKKGQPCPIHPDRVRHGQWYCHVHDPDGVFRQQHPKVTEADKAAKREARRLAKQADVDRRVAALRRSALLPWNRGTPAEQHQAAVAYLQDHPHGR